MVRGQVLLLSIALMSSAGIIKGDEPPARNQLPEQGTVTHDIIENASSLSKTDFGKIEPAASDLASISWNAEYFKRIWPADEYLYGLAVDNWQLRQIATAIQQKSKPDFEQWAEQIADVRDDVSAKVHLILKRHKGVIALSPDGWIPAPTHELVNYTVKVTATTLDKDGKEVSNYEVWFCLKGLINYKDRYDRYDRLSSPTERKMAPGNYVFWARKGSDEGAKVVIKGIGYDGQDRKIDLPTPQ
jgi:hypothetical protein